MAIQNEARGLEEEAKGKEKRNMMEGIPKKYAENYEEDDVDGWRRRWRRTRKKKRSGKRKRRRKRRRRRRAEKEKENEKEDAEKEIPDGQDVEDEEEIKKK